MEIIKNEDNTFDINVNIHELTHIVIWSHLTGQEYRDHRREALEGEYPEVVYRIAHNVQSHLLDGMRQVATYQKLLKSLEQLEMVGDLFESN